MEMLSIGLEFDETWEGKDYLLRLLDSYVGEEWFEGGCSHKLSRRAAEYTLRHPGDRENRADLKEYCALRNVVRWHVYQAVPASDLKAREAAAKCLPDLNHPSLWESMMDMPDIDSCLSNTLASEKGSFDSTAVLNSLVGTSISRQSLDQMLRLINLSCIPASLLLRVIHPLKIIPIRDLLMALLHVALCRRVQYLPSKFDWRHGPSCRPRRRGQIYCQAGDDADDDARVNEIAVAAFLPKVRSSDVSELSFEILAEDADSIDVGIICQTSGQNFEDGIFETSHSLKDFSSARLLWICKRNERTAISREEPKTDRNNWEYFGRDETTMEAGSVMKFELNTLEKLCRVQYNGVEAVWMDLSDGDYYIAAGFNN